jgi:hypothetical protein
MIIEVPDAVKALEELFEITLNLRTVIAKHESNPSEENRKKRLFWEQRRDKWINHHKVK